MQESRGNRTRRLLLGGFVAGALALGFQSTVIYGPDDRQDVYEVTDAGMLGISQATIGLFSQSKITDAGNGTFDISTSIYNVCPEEVFSDQPTSAFCSGFLVSQDVIVTAGHCVTSQASCNTTKFVFGFQMAGPGDPVTNVPADNVYSCDTLIDRQQAGADWAVIKLDRAVAGRTPVVVRTSGTVAVNDDVGVVGHPTGLPQKIAGGAVVRSISNGFFTANLDTYGGNSGSPVFNLDDFTVEGILVRGETDFVNSGGGCQSCQVSKVCPSTGCRGEDVTNAIEFVSVIP